MNCLDFRRAYLTDPYNLEAEQVTHVRECDACARYANKQTAADRRLEAALRIPVPKELGPNIIFERSMRGRRSLRVFAMAAGVMLTVAATFGIALYGVGSGQNFGEEFKGEFIAHMAHDPIHMQSASQLTGQQAGASLQQVALEMGIDVGANIDNVIAAKRCDLDGHQAAHFVVEEEGVRATAFLLPNESLEQSEWMDNESGQHGMLIPTKGGVIAVFCPERQMLVRVGEQLQNSVKWSSS